MAKLIFGMMQSLDGYVADAQGALPAPPGVELGRHFSDYVRGLAGVVYGRMMYDVMRYWDEDQPDWDEPDHEFAALWRSKPKWVVSRTLKAAGPNATIVDEDFVARLKTDLDGVLDVAGPTLAASLSKLGLIDEYRLYIRPFVLGGGKPFFTAAPPPLQLIETRVIPEDAVLLTYVPR